MDACQHTRQRGREGEKGLWCEACGIKVYDVDPRPCGSCQHFSLSGHALGSCRRHLMAVTTTMNVTFRVGEGTCFEAAQAA